MSVNASKARWGVDGDMILRAYSATEVATEAVTVNDGIDLNLLSAAYWQDDTIPFGEVSLAIQVTNADFTSMDETYTFTAYVDDLADMSDSPVAVGAINVLGGSTGIFHLPIDGRVIEALDTDVTSGSKFLSFALTSSGTTPLIAFGIEVVGKRAR